MHLFPIRFLAAYEELGSKRAEESPWIRARDGKGRGEERWTGMITLFVVNLAIKEIETVWYRVPPVDWIIQKRGSVNEIKRTETAKRLQCMRWLTSNESKFSMTRVACVRPWKFWEAPPLYIGKLSAWSIICVERKKIKRIFNKLYEDCESRGLKYSPYKPARSPLVIRKMLLITQARERKHLLTFLEDYEDDKDDPKYYK